MRSYEEPNVIWVGGRQDQGRHAGRGAPQHFSESETTKERVRGQSVSARENSVEEEVVELPRRSAFFIV